MVDVYGPANARGSSGDESRIVRCGYGPDAIYSAWAWRSLGLWRELFDRVGNDTHAPLFHPCGVLWLAGGDDPYTKACYETLQRQGQAVNLFDRLALRTRFPHIAADDVKVALFEPDCGVVMARRAVQTLVAHLERHGARLLRGHVIVPRAEQSLT